MSYRTLAALLGASMLLAAPLAAATHEKEEGPPNSTFGYIGGFRTEAFMDVVLQELDANGNPKVSSSTEQLQTTGTYDCATGAPSVGANSGKFSFDVVPMNDFGLYDYGDDHLLIDLFAAAENDVEGTVGDDPAGQDFFEGDGTTSNVAYGADVYLGYGESRSDRLNPGYVTFRAFVYCGGQEVGVLPQISSGLQTPGLFGWIDEETLDGDEDGNDFDEEFTFEYQTPATDAKGQVLPGDTRTTSFWLMNDLILWSDRWTYTPTFRFAVNPVLTVEYPGYVGSRYDGAERNCLVNGEAGAGSGAFGNCGEANPSRFNSGAAVGDAPILEDIERFGSLDSDVSGEDSVIEALDLELSAALAFAEKTTDPYLPTVDPFAPTPISGAALSEIDFGDGWKLYLDVYHYTMAVAYGAAIDPLYGSALTEGPNAYPPGQSYSAWLGLAKDANNDSTIDIGNPAEWWGIDDLLSDGNQTWNWGDVGTTEEGVDVLSANTPIVSYDFCDDGVEVSDGTTALAMSNPDMDNCNEGQGDNATGWGTWYGQRSDSLEGTFALHGRYDNTRVFNTVAGSFPATWTTTVSARIQFPPATAFAAAGIFAPSAGIDLSTFAGETFVVVDVDVYASITEA